VAFDIKKGKVALLGRLSQKLTSFLMWPDVTCPNGCVRNIRHTLVFKCLIKRHFDLLGPRQANAYNKRRYEI
jgi:hypothetical protein